MRHPNDSLTPKQILATVLTHYNLENVFLHRERDFLTDEEGEKVREKDICQNQNPLNQLNNIPE